MSESFEYKQTRYPEYIRHGNHAQYIAPIAEKVCIGEGIDVGAFQEKWKFKNAKICDLTQPEPWNDANELPVKDESQDYVFSSHCLEHIHEWVDVLEYWHNVLKIGGVLFLYLPHYNQEYWRPWNNRKHYNIFTVEILRDWMEHKGFINIFCGEKDLNDSFMIVGEKSNKI